MHVGFLPSKTVPPVSSTIVELPIADWGVFIARLKENIYRKSSRNADKCDRFSSWCTTLRGEDRYKSNKPYLALTEVCFCYGMRSESFSFYTRAIEQSYWSRYDINIVQYAGFGAAKVLRLGGSTAFYTNNAGKILQWLVREFDLKEAKYFMIEMQPKFICNRLLYGF